jgi:hypothetical protein
MIIGDKFMDIQHSQQLADRANAGEYAYKDVIKKICNLKWNGLTNDETINIAWAYYYFSTQFRENLEVAIKLFPDDQKLQELDLGERNTDNLSPYPGVAGPGEKLNHDEFMRRTLELTPIPEERRRRLEALGQAYLAEVRAVDDITKVISLATYEDGGLEAVFRAILTAPNWDGKLLGAFKHFLIGHIELDSDPDGGHGSLCRHVVPDDRVLPLWTAFYRIFVEAAPALNA